MWHTAEAVAEITTPGLTGALVQVLAAPLVILLDAVSFVGSAVCVLGIRQPEPARPPPCRRGSTSAGLAGPCPVAELDIAPPPVGELAPW